MGKVVIAETRGVPVYELEVRGDVSLIEKGKVKGTKVPCLSE